MKSNILITGGCGFIGSSFLDLLFNSNKFNLVNIDNLTYAANKEYAKVKISNYKFIKGNILSYNLINQILKKYKPKFIFNFAAESHVDNSITKPKIFLDTNVSGTYNILKNIIDLKLEKKIKFIQISTDEVFGDRFKKNSSNENTVYNPSSPYSASKAAADHLVTSWSRTYGVNYNITYSSNNFGPRQNKEKFIPKIISNCISNKKIPIYGPGKQKRHWIYVMDNARAILKIGTSKKVNQSYNIPGNKFISNINLAKKICNLFNKKNVNSKNYLTLITHVEDRKGHDKIYKLNPYKFFKNFDFRNKFSFEVGLKNTIEYYKDQKNLSHN